MADTLQTLHFACKQFCPLAGIQLDSYYPQDGAEPSVRSQKVKALSRDASFTCGQEAVITNRLAPCVAAKDQTVFCEVLNIGQCNVLLRSGKANKFFDVIEALRIKVCKRFKNFSLDFTVKHKSSPLMKLVCVRAISVVRWAARLIGCAGVFHACSVFFLPESVSPKHP